MAAVISAEFLAAGIPDRAVGLVAHAARDVRVEPVAVRAPGPDGAVVEIAYGGICGSDLHYWQHGAACSRPVISPSRCPPPSPGNLYPVDDALVALATAADPVRSGKVLLTFDPALAPSRAGPPR